MKIVIDAFVNRSRVSILLMMVIFLVGYVDYQKIPKESNPDIKIPIIYTVVTLQGISPEDSERLILRPLENALRGVESIKEMTSYASEGSGSVIIEFNAGLDNDKALRDVRDKVNAVLNKLPKDADQPIIQQVDFSLFPVLQVALTGDVPERTLIQHARNLQEKIESVPGVLNVKVGGDRDDSLEIEIDPKDIENYGLEISAITQIIDANNRLVAAGSIRNGTGEFSIKVPSLITDLSGLLKYPIKAHGANVVTIGDIAKVKRTFKEAATIARVNGKPAVVLEVSKRTGENIITTVANVKAMIEKEKKYWPGGIEIIYSQDNSERIIDMVEDLENNIIFGVLLVMIVVIYAVGVRSALLISLSIPFSFLAGITFLAMCGYTLNIVVLFSLILTIGMIVDDAIVVSEYADRIMHDGVSENEAFSIAAKRMIWPIVTSTLVKIVVFLPLLFWPGTIGQFMKYMPITVIAILTNSLLFALFIQPSLGPFFGKPTGYDAHEIASLKAADDGDLSEVFGATKVYLGMLTKVLNNAGKFVLGIVGFLFIVYAYFAMLGKGFEFFPRVEPSSASVRIESPGNLSIYEKDEILKEVEKRILAIDDLKVSYTKVGKMDNNTLPEDTIGMISIEYKEWQERNKSLQIIERIRDLTKDIPGINMQILEAKNGPQAEKPIGINVTSHYPQMLGLVADALIDIMKQNPAFTDIEDSRSARAIEWKIVVDREKAAEYLLDIGTIGNAIKLASNGLKVSSYRPDDAVDEVDVLVRFPEEYRNISSLGKIQVVTRDSRVIPISTFLEIKPAQQVSRIKKVDREVVISVASNMSVGYLADTEVTRLKEIVNDKKFTEVLLQRAKAANLDVPASVIEDVKVIFKGDDEKQQETSAFLKNAFMVTLLMMFTLMLVQFNSYYHTIVVMSAVFLSTVGVLLGLIITNQTFGIVMCGIGIIALGGVVLNNNILFIDTYQHLRKEGMEIDEAIIRSGIQRLRPILLTATTAVLGLLPMVFGLTILFTTREITYDAPSSQWWRQLSASIAGGLTFATILTLFFTPCLLKLGKRFDPFIEKKPRKKQI